MGRRSKSYIGDALETVYERDGEVWIHQWEEPTELKALGDGRVAYESRNGEPRTVRGRDGRPWLINGPTICTGRRRRHPRSNPQFLTVYGNPEEETIMARRRTPPRGKDGKFRKRRRSTRRRSTRRRGTPRRASSRRRRSAPRRSRAYRRRARRNPPRMLSILPDATELGSGVAGAFGTRLVPGFLSVQFPQIPTAGPAGMLTKAATAVGLGIVARMLLGKKVGDHVALGGLIVVGDQAVREYVEPQLGISGYVLDEGVGEFLPDPGIGAPQIPAATYPAIGMDDDGGVGDYEATVSRLNAGGRL